METVSILAAIGLGIFVIWQRSHMQRLRNEVTTRDTQISSLKGELATQAKSIELLEGQSAEVVGAAKKLQAVFEVVADSAYDPLIVLDRDRRIVVANNAASEILNDGGSHIGKTLDEAVESAELADIVRNVLENNERIVEEQLTIGGATYRVRLQLMLSESASDYLGIAFQNVTQLIRLNRARRDLVANISHELRTPIANIRLIIESLFHEKDRPKRKDSISSLRAIATETDTLLWLAQELLDLSMIESGQAIMKMVNQPLDDVVLSAVGRLEDQLDPKNLKISHQIPKTLNVLCDTDQTKRVLVNLIHNAIKWSPKNGTIRVTVTEGDEDLTLTVSDDGPGVPDDQCERIFERFYQVDASRSEAEGTGLGLAICRHIVEAQGGSIWATGNSQAKGGHFSFTLLRSVPEHVGVKKSGGEAN